MKSQQKLVQNLVQNSKKQSQLKSQQNSQLKSQQNSQLKSQQHIGNPDVFFFSIAPFSNIHSQHFLIS